MPNKQMNLFSIIVLFAACAAHSQEIDVQVMKLPANGVGDTGHVYSLHVFNNLSNPIAIKCSNSFVKFSNRDTLRLAIGDWYNGDGKTYFYGIDYSEHDAKFSEYLYYQLLILNPQTYLFTNINLTDLDKYRTKTVKFSLDYTTDVTDEELKKYSTRQAKEVMIIKESKNFRSKVVDIE